MARRSNRTRFVRPAPRSMIWVGAGITNLAVAASSATLIGTLNAAALLLRPFTVVRTRLVIQFISDQTAVTEFTQAAYGLQVVTEAAATAGIASIPTPITEVNADYFVYQPLMQNFAFVSGVGILSNQGQGNYWTVDSKAMRKVDVDDDIVQTVELRSATGADIAVEGRMLVKLH